ncbi:MAG: aminotransferase class IV [Acidimicrobiales bacterium]
MYRVRVATGNGTNFFIVRDGELWTSTGEHKLHGITRAVVLEEAEADGIVTRRAPFSLTGVYSTEVYSTDVYSADEAFVTGTFGGLTPVTHVDGRRIGAGERTTTEHLGRLYDAAVARSVAS